MVLTLVQLGTQAQVYPLVVVGEDGGRRFTPTLVLLLELGGSIRSDTSLPWIWVSMIKQVPRARAPVINYLPTLRAGLQASLSVSCSGASL